MRRNTSVLLLSSAFLFHVACSSDGGGTGGKGGAGGRGGAGGQAQATGGSGTAGQGGGGAGGVSPTGGQGAVDAGSTDALGDAVGTGGSGGTGSDAATDGGSLSPDQLRGQYLVKSVLGCAGCHTPSLPTGGPDPSKLLSGNECFTKDSGGACLASANLTNDDTGLKKLTDQQIKDAFTKGIDPEKAPGGGTQYLFSQMPYYQFGTLSDTDANAIVSYLRTVTAVSHEAPANGGTFATQPTSPQWASVALADFPNAAADAGAGAENGKYLASLMCATCHTLTATTTPLQLSASKAYQGGKEFKQNFTVPASGAGGAGGTGAGGVGGVGGAAGATGAGGAAGAGGAGGAATMTIAGMIQSTNLTPDGTTGTGSWTVEQIVTAIKMGKDEGGRTICSAMRAFPLLSDSDATDIAAYLKAIPPVSNAITETCER